ncbi:MAG: aspartate ammonia-lyase, partial [Spongiibacteraceae bacterium]|nr:aspartate ammonia-lyase [Spongiibacteraceae bacterium]
MSKSRKEHDSLGIVEVPAAARWGAQTQRAIDNFRFNGGPMPAAFVRALARIKAAAALSNAELG